MKQITGDMFIPEVLELNQNAAQILMSFGMHCLGCPIAHGETLAEAAASHNINLEEMLAKLNEQ